MQTFVQQISEVSPKPRRGIIQEVAARPLTAAEEYAAALTDRATPVPTSPNLSSGEAFARAILQ